MVGITVPPLRSELLHRARILHPRIAAIRSPAAEAYYVAAGKSRDEAAALLARTKEFMALVGAWGTLTSAPSPTPTGDLMAGVQGLLLQHTEHTTMVQALGVPVFYSSSNAVVPDRGDGLDDLLHLTFRADLEVPLAS